MGKGTDMSEEALDLGSWCILRMASCDTLSLQETLSEAGFDVWTPTEKVLLDAEAKARWLDRLKRLKRKGADKATDPSRAILPTFVFAAAHHADALIRITMNPTHEHRRFTLFRYMDGLPLVADAALNPLRELEAKRDQSFQDRKRRGRKPPVIPVDTQIAMPVGYGFDGLVGVVVRQRGKSTFLEVEGFKKPIEIASVMLVDEDECEKRQAA